MGALMFLIGACCGWILCFIAGTERCNEALEKLAAEYDIVVNVQVYQCDASACNWIKNIVDKKGFALYFSRALIPSNK